MSTVGDVRSRAGFLLEAPLVTYRRLAEADLRKHATAPEIAALHANPILWYRALCHIKFDVQNHIAKDRRTIAELRPIAGQPTPVYLEAKRDHDARTVKRLHFARAVERRIAEVRSLLGSSRATDQLMLGDMVTAMLELAELARRGDMQAVQEKASFHAARWAEAAS